MAVDRHIVGRVGEDHLRRLGRHQALKRLLIGGIGTHQAALAK